MQVSRPLNKKRAAGRFFVGEFGPRQYIHVYAIRPKDGGNIKFGQALNVKSRFSGIQVGSPVKLELMGSVYVPTDTEAYIHEHLRDDKSHGEWFLPTTEVLHVAGLIVSGDKLGLIARIGLSRLLPDDVRQKINSDEVIAGKLVTCAPPQMQSFADLMRGYVRPK